MLLQLITFKYLGYIEYILPSLLAIAILLLLPIIEFKCHLLTLFMIHVHSCH